MFNIETDNRVYLIDIINKTNTCYSDIYDLLYKMNRKRLNIVFGRYNEYKNKEEFEELVNKCRRSFNMNGNDRGYVGFDFNTLNYEYGFEKDFRNHEWIRPFIVQDSLGRNIDIRNIEYKPFEIKQSKKEIHTIAGSKIRGGYSRYKGMIKLMKYEKEVEQYIRPKRRAKTLRRIEEDIRYFSSKSWKTNFKSKKQYLKHIQNKKGIYYVKQCITQENYEVNELLEEEYIYDRQENCL